MLNSQPLFPLTTPLFPGLKLDLQLFEQRYLKMFRDCMRSDSGFTVCPIREGAEVGESVRIHEIGVQARIIDWNQLPNGLLGIQVLGESRVAISNYAMDDSGLMRGDLQLKDDEVDCPIPDWAAAMCDLYLDLGAHPQVAARLPELETLGASGLGWGLAQILPMSDAERLSHLQSTDALQRLIILEQQVQLLSQK